MPKRFPSLGVGMTPSTTELGKFIRSCRIKLGLSQVEVAKRWGVWQTRQSMLELGERRYLSPQTVRALAAALQCDVVELESLVPKRRRAEPKTEFGKFIRSRREELGLTHVELGKRLRRPYQSIYSLERQHGINPGTLPRLARALELAPSALEGFTSLRGKPAGSSMGELVRSRRKELGLSQRRLAKKLRLTTQEISLIELGKVRLSSDGADLAKLAVALKLNVATLEAVKPKRKLKEVRVVPGTLGEFLFLRRRELGLTQAQVGQHAQVTPSGVCSVEQGRWRGPKTLAKISAVLDCEIPEELLPPKRKTTAAARDIAIAERLRGGASVA